MAAAAVCAEAPLVHVVGRVAGDAACAEVVPLVLAPVTVATFEAAVTVGECETCRPCMIEAGAAPAIGRVAVTAPVAPAARVNVIHRVAIDAGARSLVKAVSLVAIAAGDIAVSTRQGVAGKVVVEHGILPGGLGMAVTAVRPQAPFVRVILAVTGATVLRRIAHGCIRYMTVAARRT